MINAMKLETDGDDDDDSDDDMYPLKVATEGLDTALLKTSATAGSFLRLIVGTADVAWPPPSPPAQFN